MIISLPEVLNYTNTLQKCCSSILLLSIRTPSSCRFPQRIPTASLAEHTQGSGCPQRTLLLSPRRVSRSSMLPTSISISIAEVEAGWARTLSETAGVILSRRGRRSVPPFLFFLAEVVDTFDAVVHLQPACRFECRSSQTGARGSASALDRTKFACKSRQRRLASCCVFR